MIELKRVYDPASDEDGERILVDRLWPRGVSRERAQLYEWAKELAPSTELRTWFHKHPEAWEEFRRRYRAELREQEDDLAELAKRARKHRVTLLYGAKDAEHNHAIVLKEALDSSLKRQ